MAAKNKPYEQFGPYLLFKRLEGDSLGDLWRAARIDGDSLGPFVAVRRLTGGKRDAMVTSARLAEQVAPLLTGPSFVREQSAGVLNGIPYLSWEYSGGRSLRHIVERARGGGGVAPNPIPLDQAIVIAERVALSLATTSELRFGDERLTHGALIPQFVWITDDGEIRVAGQRLGPGLVASLSDEKVAAEIGRYLSTEYQHSGQASKASEVFSLGAILYLTVTGHEPPDATRASAFVQTVRGAKTMSGGAVPDDLRQILEKSLNLDPAARYASVSDLKHALSAASSSHGATSFNLAFYLSNLLKKEMESEALDREREAKTNVLPYLETADAAPPPVVAEPWKQEVVVVEPSRSRVPLFVAAALLIALAVAGWLFFGSKGAATATPTTTVASNRVAAPAPAPVVPEPIVATLPGTSTAVPPTETGLDDATRKKAFEDAVKQKLNAEMLKLQTEHTRQLQQQQSRNAPVVIAPPVTAPVTAAVPEEREASAAQFDEQRRASARAQTPVQPQPQPPPSVTQPAPAVATPAPPTTPIREGDVVEMANLDVAPRRVRDPRVTYPPIAARQRIETTVIASVLVSETGDVIDVKILRGDARFGFNEAAIRALQGARYSSPMKDGKRVRTWLPQAVQFKP